MAAEYKDVHNLGPNNKGGDRKRKTRVLDPQYCGKWDPPESEGKEGTRWETYAQIWGFPTFLDHFFFSMNVNSPVYREEMAHKTQEINKTYKAQKAHESIQTLKPPHTMEPHQATQGARGHSFKWCSGGISSDRVVYFCKQWHWFIKLDLNTVISWACHGYRYPGQINTDVHLLRKNQTTLRRGWHLSPIR